MKNKINSARFDFENKLHIHKKSQSEIIEFKQDINNIGHYVLRIRIDQLNGGNYKIALNKNLLTVILFETVDFDRPMYSHHININEFGDHPVDDVVNIFDFKLPDDSYYLVHHETGPLKNILKVTLGKMNFN